MHPKFVEDAIIKLLEDGCIQLIPKVIKHMKRCRAKGVLIVPEWHSGLFWPVLCKNQYEFEHLVKDVFVLPKIHDLILEGPG